MMFRDYREFGSNADWSWAIQHPSLTIGWPKYCTFHRGTLRDLERDICGLSHSNVAHVVAIASPDGTRLDNARCI